MSLVTAHCLNLSVVAQVALIRACACICWLLDFTYIPVVEEVRWREEQPWVQINQRRHVVRASKWSERELGGRRNCRLSRFRLRTSFSWMGVLRPWMISGLNFF